MSDHLLGPQEDLQKLIFFNDFIYLSNFPPWGLELNNPEVRSGTFR